MAPLKKLNSILNRIMRKIDDQNSLSKKYVLSCLAAATAETGIAAFK